ncbi:uncharacterized protein PpBr36_11433 [Pyricularia pennisetigena]|uniref:uncharacterized protein n=1 Tax=Pyricularia pennisetigena TaxID=1578925 RepID=UPI001152EAF2|nr:uncharacterized protein PpBr36_11433 [Pyricularia pennisetigena]TLS20296.1 hypothetical protein PpBr36_11433 [Pyricularia pennisetigena]
MSAIPFPVFAPPSASETALAPYEVRIRHPAYPKDTPPLLLLSAADGIGLEYDMAIISCCIICATEWDKGKLANETAYGTIETVLRPSDGILRGREYFFCIDGFEQFSGFKTPEKYETTEFPRTAERRPLPEDWAMRGLVWADPAEVVFPRKYFAVNESMEENERTFETPSMGKAAS